MGLDNLKGLLSDNMPLRGGFGHSRKEKSNQTDELKESKVARGRDNDPNVFTKTELEALRAKISRFGGKLPVGLERVIGEFDKVDTDSDGKVTKTQLQQYARANGFKLPRLGSSEALRDLIFSRPDGSPNLNRHTRNDDAVDLSKFTAGIGLRNAAEHSQAAAQLLRSYTAQGTWDDSEAEPETGILPILTDTKA